MQYKKSMLLSFFILLISLVFSGTAHAQVVAPQVTSCTSPEVSGFRPFVYDGELNSFNYVLPSFSKNLPTVTIDGTVLGTQFTSIWPQQNGVRYHVDVPSWIPMGNPVLVKIKEGAGECAREYTFLVELPRKPLAATPASPQKPPTAPTTKIDIQCVERNGSLDITWRAETKTGDSFVLKRGEGGSAPEVIIPQLPEDVRGFTDILVSPGTQYSYQTDLIRANTALASSNIVSCSVEPRILENPVTATTSETQTCTTFPLGIWITFLILHIAVLLGVIGHLDKLLVDGGGQFIIALCIPFFVLCGIWIAFDTCRAYPAFPALVAFLTLLTLVTPNLLKNK